MNLKKKNKIAAIILAVLGVAIGIIGMMGNLTPPIITGVGFLVLAWTLFD